MGFIELGYFGMFLAAFLAATILPLGSEPVLVALMFAGLNSLGLLIAATLGNTLGGLSTFGIGYLGQWKWIEGVLKISHKSLQKAQKTVEKYGVWCAFLCWLPLIGDPIALALGFFRINFWKVALLMLLSKAARYYFLIYLVE
jgi:membrane protein YqaA with SNARE-associated domain